MPNIQDIPTGSGYRNDDRASVHISHISNDSVDVGDGPSIPVVDVRINPTIYPSGT